MKLLNPNEKVVMNSRQIWNEAMAEIGTVNENVVALTADVSRSVCTEIFRKQFPERYLNVGIAEQNMLGTAAGLAMTGKLPYCCAFAPFLTMRAIEQFRTDCCYMNLNVKMVGAFGGTCELGPTHSGLEDAGFIRGIANGAVICPSDPGMVKKAFAASLEYEGSLYIRLGGGANDPQIYDEDYELKIGKAIIAKEGTDATIISFGLTLKYAVEAAAMLAQEGLSVGIIDMHTLKPLDKEAVLQAAAATGKIVTVEDHSIYNGLGTAVAEVLMDEGTPCKLRRLGIPDLYPSYGDNRSLHAKYGYDAAAIVKAIKSMF